MVTGIVATTGSKLGGLEKMAKAYVKEGILYVEAPFNMEGKPTASRKNVLHATTEAGTIDALVIQQGGKKINVQLNAWSVRVPEAKPVAK